MSRFTFKLFMSLLLILPVLVQAQTKLTLQDCIDLGLQGNQSLRINRYSTERSLSQAKSSIGLVLPTVNYSLSAGSSDSPFTNGWQEGYGTSLVVGQNLWDGGVWWNTLKSAQVAQDAAEIQLSSYEVNTVYQVKVAFYNYLSTRKLNDVYQDNLKTSTYQHQLTLERFKLGAASQNDTLRTRVNIEQARLQIINGEAELATRARDLNIILGREWDSPVDLQEPTWVMIQVPQASTLESQVLAQNPNLMLLDRNREVSKYDVKIARAGYIPSLGLSASYSNSSLALGDVYSDLTASTSASVSLNWNLFNGNRTKRAVEQSKISAKMAQENYELSSRNAVKDLVQTVERMETLKQSVEISQLILNASEQDLLLAQEQYKIGSLSILDVLMITASFEDAKSNLIRARYNLKIAEAGLHQLMGKR